MNAAITAGTYNPEEPTPLPCDAVLRGWIEAHGPTLKPSYQRSAGGLIKNHLVPWFRDRDLREISEDDLLAFAKAKLDDGRAVSTVRNALSVLRRTCSLAVRREVEEVETWRREQVGVILAEARRLDPGLYPLLAFLFGTGCRRGEALVSSGAISTSGLESQRSGARSPTGT